VYHEQLRLAYASASPIHAAASECYSHGEDAAAAPTALASKSADRKSACREVVEHATLDVQNPCATLHSCWAQARR